VTVLLLAGTSEAQRIARALAARGTPAIASLAGGTRAPRPQPLQTREGGFGGADGFRRFLQDRGISTVLDATHPFAHRMSQRAAEICGDLSIPYCQFLRPAWRPGPGDRWTEVAREEDVAAHVPEGAVVFLATGRPTLTRFANLSHATIICRQIDAEPDTPFPFPHGRYLVGHPPFSVEEEEALFRDLGVDWLVVKNAGGTAPMSKLVAARNLGLPVAMIARPPQPQGVPRVETVEAALDWLQSQVPA
jgi:precorrin-6A/cobalt-precorrin-6A reductase